MDETKLRKYEALLLHTTLHTTLYHQRTVLLIKRKLVELHPTGECCFESEIKEK
jgi:hypothetical protein